MSRTSEKQRLERRIAQATIGHVEPYAGPRHVRLVKAADLTGYSVKALERKIESGKWPEGIVWRKSPDGERLVMMDGYEKWAMGELQCHGAGSA